MAKKDFFEERLDFYKGDKATSALKMKQGGAVFEKSKMSFFRQRNTVLTWIPIILVVPVILIAQVDIIPAAVIGGVMGGVGHLVVQKFFPAKLRDEADVVISLEDIEKFKVESATGKISVASITTKDKEVWSFHTKEASMWKELLKK